MKKLRIFVQRQGFFIMLAICVLIIAGSGFWAFRARNAEPEPSLAADSLPEFVQTLDQAEKLRLYRPVAGELLSGFSTVAYQSTLNRWGAHEAVDFLAEKGEDVFSAQAGTVTDAFRDPQWGGVIIVTHDGGVTTKYRGLEWPPVLEIGNKIEAGAHIGTIGTLPIESGDFSHLHFEMWIDGRAADPSPYL